MFKKVLYATDLSERSLAILDSLPEFKCLGLEEVVIFRVINLTRVLGVARGIDIDAYIREIEKETIPKLEEIAEKIRGMGFVAKPIIPPPAGDPVSEIARIANEEGVDAIVMGSRGRSTIKAILLGSTAEGVVRKSDKPVIVFKNHTPKIFSKIVYAHDFSDKAEKLGKYVKFVAKSCNSDVIVVHILEKGEVLEESKLDEIELEFKNEGIDVKIIIGEGSPSKEIVKIAEKEGATCIFVGRSGRGAGVLGSTADFVIRYSKVPVFVA
ncbi:universal stress protein [Archaeoglobus profundus]|uniref:UspA domain protein n=1 Tax=Archaeoglobus profundus (strain DSM 5631 / JCM 9629 / NBRC 100127 / Av18) TaxID=572546 RepID=D2RDE7_ARCPA|nr:universal stress protein [Archaeoglobus profundus]ADB58141.1 UspA domain protein [Archaeoglobus profundus DSM 5631]